MGVSGSGLGRPMEPLITELQASAAVEVAKQSMGIVRDTLDVVFTQLGGNVWTYKADVGHPVLHPMNTFRVDAARSGEEDALGRKEAFDGLVKLLPPALQRLLAIDMRRDPEHRNPSMVALEEVFSGAAKAMAMIKGAMAVALPDSAQAVRHKENQLLLPRGLSAAQQFSGDLAQFSEGLLQQEGPNMKQFDEFFAATEELGRFSKLLAKAGEPGTADKFVERWSSLQHTVQTFDRMQSGSPLQILGASLRAMQPLIAAAMPGVKAPALLMGMWTALVGAGNSEAKGGVQGAGLEHVNRAISQGLADLSLPNGGNPGQRLFLQLLTQTTTLLALAGGTILADTPVPVGIAPDDVPQYRPFTCTLAMGFTQRSQAAEIFLGQAFAAVQAEEQARLMAARAAANVGKFAMGFAMGKKKGGEGLLGCFSGQIAAMEAGVAMLQERGGLTDAQAAAFSQALSEAKFALEQGDAEPFMQIWSDLIDSLGGDYSKVEKDCNLVGKKAKESAAMVASAQKERQGFQTCLIQPA